MGFVAAKCTQCGANIKVDESKDSGICSHCNTVFVMEKVINNYNSIVNNNHNNRGATIVGDNELKKLLDAAKGFERLGQIENAYKTYMRIAQEYPQKFDGWWGLISCKLSLSVEKNKSLSLWEMATTFNFEEIASEYEKNLNNYILAARKLATPDQLKMIDDKMIEYKNDIDQILLKKFEEASIKIRNSYKSIDDLYDEMIKTSVGYVGRNEKKVREYFFEIRPDKKKRVVYLLKINEAHHEYSQYNHKDSIENRTEILGLSNNNELLLNDKVSQYKIEYSRNKGKKGNLYNAFAMYKGSIHLSKS